MKFAFVGKGGSGKSTLSSLFIRYLQGSGKQNVLAIDADLNMNLAGLLGVQVEEDKLMSRPNVALAIRRHLQGDNRRIKDVSKFLPTTPPGTGSNLIACADEQALLPYMVPVSLNPTINLLTVGSYDGDGIGQTCYHSHLFVAENILSHTASSETFAVVCDMVAGTDAFAYSMHLQFDVVVLIAEPIPESLEVCEHYIQLARQSSVDGLLCVVANKIEDEEDLQFIRRRLGMEPVGVVPAMPKLKKARQQKQAVTQSIFTPALIDCLRAIELRGKAPALSAAQRLTMLHQLHRKLNAKQWVKQGYGDLAEQIDPDFQMPNHQNDGDSHQSGQIHNANQVRKASFAHNENQSSNLYRKHTDKHMRNGTVTIS